MLRQLRAYGERLIETCRIAGPSLKALAMMPTLTALWEGIEPGQTSVRSGGIVRTGTDEVRMTRSATLPRSE